MRTRLIVLLTFAQSLSLLACGGDDPENIEDAGTDVAADTATDTEADDTGDADTNDDVEADTAVDEDTAPTDVTDTGPLPYEPPGPIDPACWTDLAPGEVEVLATGFEENTEGIAFGPDGALYVSSANALLRIDAEGNVTPFAEVPTALGFALTSEGDFVVASIGESINADVIDGAVYTVSADGEATMIADGIASPNFITMLPDGSALVSDDFDTRVWRVTRGGEVSVAIEDIEAPNGMAFSPDDGTLYVVSTFNVPGHVTAFPVGEDGLPTAEGELIAALGNFSTPDGVAVGELGTLFVAANVKGTVFAIDPVSYQVSEVNDDLGSPASLAFGVAPDFDPCSIYITQLFGTDVLRLAVGQRGEPLP